MKKHLRPILSWVYFRVNSWLGTPRPAGEQPVYPIRPIPLPVVDENNHPERNAPLPYCAGRGLEIGCGHRKIMSKSIGVDLLGMGEVGRYGVMEGRASVADIQASGDFLPMFSDGEMDYVLSCHNLEHYIDTLKTLLEWKRILKPGGKLILIVPDERAGDTLYLDPTHKHCFTPDSLSRLIGQIGDFTILHNDVVIPNWSFMLVAEKR